MTEEGIEDTVRWTLDQLKTRLPSMVTEAGYEEIAKRINQQFVAENLNRFEPDILAKFWFQGWILPERQIRLRLVFGPGALSSVRADIL